jgi:pimeloyl-ACP methyl ester carboxylesterase
LTVHIEQETDCCLRERAGYFTVSGADLYTVLHEVPDPVARVLLIGPFASERHNSYLPWVRWARYLAERRIEVLRYDYRGVGESTGVFEELTFKDWAEDVKSLAEWLESRFPHVPLVLQGLEVGSLLAGDAFHNGIGDAALLWSPPASAQHALRSTLMRWVGLEHLYRPAEEVKSASQYIADLEQGLAIEVEGYQWTSRLWADSFLFQLPSPMTNSDQAALFYRKPISIKKLDRQAAPLVKGGFVGYDEAKDFSWLFSPNADWIAASAVRADGRMNEAGN